MPISPTPPSAAKTSSSPRPAISPYTASRSHWTSSRAPEQYDVTRGDDGLSAVRRDQHQATGIVETFEAADKLAVGESDADRVAEPGCAGEPIGPDGRKALAAVPLRQPPRHFDRERREQRGRGDLRAAGGKVGRRIGGVRRVRRAVDPDADGHRPRLLPGLALALDQDTGEFGGPQREGG